jgi:hypothetical protein
VIACIVAHDWEGFACLFAGEFRCSDRRRVVQLELDRAQYIAFTREAADGRTVQGESRLIATRGERLALMRSTFVFSDADIGPSEIAFFIIQEIDAHGRIVAYVRFDLEDLDAAYAELDRRYEAGEAAGCPVAPLAFARAVMARDWAALAALCGPTFVQYDHRPFAILGTTYGGEEWARNSRALVDLAPDTRPRIDHVRHHGRGFLMEMAWQGTREGGPYEIPVTVVIEVDENGKLIRDDLYDQAQLDEIRARFAELAAGFDTRDRDNGGRAFAT